MAYFWIFTLKMILLMLACGFIVGGAAYVFVAEWKKTDGGMKRQDGEKDDAADSAGIICIENIVVGGVKLRCDPECPKLYSCKSGYTGYTKKYNKAMKEAAKEDNKED